MTWVLIVSMYAGMMSKHNSVALTHVEGFSSEAHCKTAGVKAAALATGTMKKVSFVCVETK